MNHELFNESNRATYCPEDDKLRLYVGRVPREEYLALRADGWTSTPKQDCDFFAIWTTSREDTALAYAGIIEDEDAGPAERAADRAERFSGYLDKRLSEASAHADHYDSGPSAHGYQSKARAVRAADRHDRRADRALNAWDKAEYWQARTAGVIGNALHNSSPSVRMGRLKTLESDLRKSEKRHAQSREIAQARFDSLLSVVEHAAGKREKPMAPDARDFRWELSKIREAEGVQDDVKSTPEQIRRALLVCALDRLDDAKTKEAKTGTRPAAEIAQEWIDANPRPQDWDPEKGTRYTRHLKLRIAYELQMLEAQGGRAAMVEMEIGGFISGMQIHKVNKSPATGRVVSVSVKLRTNGKNRWGNPYPEGKDPIFRMENLNIERARVDSYRPPTDEERQTFHAARKAEKDARPKITPLPLINPTLAEAQRLQEILNSRYAAEWERCHGKPSQHHKPSLAEVACMTQASYSAQSTGAHARAFTREFLAHGRNKSISRAKKQEDEDKKGPPVCKLRVSGFDPYRVIHITDKPTKPLPAAIWEPYTPTPAAAPAADNVTPFPPASAPELVTSLPPAPRWEMPSF